MNGGRRVGAVILDMDNTLFDLVGAKYAACRAITREAGCGDPESLFSYFLREGKGFEDPENIREYFLDRGLVDADLLSRCTAIYREAKLAAIQPYPGVRETLHALREKGLRLALVTDAHSRDAAPRLEKTGLSGLFDHVVTFDATWQKKPSPVPFGYALKLLGCRPREAIAIGDSPRRDIAPCRRLGMITVYARYGDRFARPDTTGGAHFAIDSPLELLSILETVAGGDDATGFPCAAGSLSP
ncbi:MAG: HAD family hydrolase [Methanolinea sp.]